jgi:hypothetical protein
MRLDFTPRLLLDPLQDKIDAFNQGLDKAEQRMADLAAELGGPGSSVVTNLSNAIAAARGLSDPLSDVSDITKKLNKLQQENEARIIRRKVAEESYARAIGTVDEASALNSLKKASAELQVNQMLEDQLRKLEGIAEEEAKITEEKKKQNNLAALIDKKYKDISDTIKGWFALGSIIDMLFKGSENIANFRKELGISYENAYKLNTEIGFVGNNVFDAYINGEKLKKSFTDLSVEMGMVVDYGNESLVTMTNLTGRLGMNNKEAAQLTTLARMQSTNTEAVLNNVGKAVTAMNKQGKTAILLKDVMKEVANVSKATAVSLGNNPVKIAEAVTAAKQLGTTMSQLESTADALLNFETSIEDELKAELLTGKQMNLERARAAALANDMKGLAKEIGENEEVIGAFASGNRLAQEATAKALGMNREQLASMVYQQEALKIGADGVRAKYGEQAYEQLKAQNAQEKFNNSVEKLKTALSSVVQIFSPILDLLATASEFIANILSQWYIFYPLVGLIALSYLPKMASSFANIGKSITGIGTNFTKIFSKEGRASLLGGGVTDKGADAAGGLANKVTGSADDVTSKTKGGGVGGFLKGIKMSDVLKGAAAILILSAALFVAAKAFQQFAMVEWESIAKGGVALLGLAGVAFLLGKMTGPILQGSIALAILGAALIPLGYALNLAAPGIEAFGKAIKSTFEGIATIITAAATGIATIFGSLQNVDVMKLLAIGPALIGIGVGLASLGAGGVISAIGAFLGGDPIEKLKGLAASGDGLAKTAIALQAIAGALTGVSTALATIDTSKLEALDEFSNNQASNSAVSGITNFITAPIKAVGGAIGGDKEKGNTSIDFTPMITAINEMKVAINELQKRPVVINMDGKQIGSNLVQGSYKLA